MRPIPSLVLVAGLIALAGCHSRGGYFSSDPSLALGPGCPDCPSRARWPAYFGTAGEIPQAGSLGYARGGSAPAPAVVAAPSRPSVAAVGRVAAPPVSVPLAPRSASVRVAAPRAPVTIEPPRLDADFGVPVRETVRPPVPVSSGDELVVPPRPGAPLPPPATPPSITSKDVVR